MYVNRYNTLLFSVSCILSLWSFRLLVSGPDRSTDKIVKQTHRRNSNGYRPSLSNTAMFKPDLTIKNEILTKCWFIIGQALQMKAQYWIDIGLASRVCCRRGTLSLFARLSVRLAGRMWEQLTAALRSTPSLTLSVWRAIIMIIIKC